MTTDWVTYLREQKVWPRRGGGDPRETTLEHHCVLRKARERTPGRERSLGRGLEVETSWWPVMRGGTGRGRVTQELVGSLGFIPRSWGKPLGALGRGCPVGEDPVVPTDRPGSPLPTKRCSGARGTACSSFAARKHHPPGLAADTNRQHREASALTACPCLPVWPEPWSGKGPVTCCSFHCLSSRKAKCSSWLFRGTFRFTS